MESIQQFLIDNLTIIYILTFAVFLGIDIISKVPTVLHTPLMSGANAISGVVIMGGIILVRQAESTNYLVLILGFLGIALASINVVGGFAVTGRMLYMFKRKKKN